jgi:hypothetical protein
MFGMNAAFESTDYNCSINIDELYLPDQNIGLLDIDHQNIEPEFLHLDSMPQDSGSVAVNIDNPTQDTEVPVSDNSRPVHYSVYMGPPEWKRDILIQNIERVKQDIANLSHELECAIKDYEFAQKLYVKFGNTCGFLHSELIQRMFKVDMIRYKLNNTYGVYNYMVIDLNQEDGLHYLHKHASI